MKDPSDCSLLIVKTAFGGLECLTNLGPKISKIVPPEIKEVDSLIEFKNKIRLWNPTNYSCHICTKIAPGFVDLTDAKL